MILLTMMTKIWYVALSQEKLLWVVSEDRDKQLFGHSGWKTC